MKLYLEVTLNKTDGKRCDEDAVFMAVEEHLDGESLYPQNPDADEESTYEVESVILKPTILTLAQIKDGTGFAKGAKFVEVS